MSASRFLLTLYLRDLKNRSFNNRPQDFKNSYQILKLEIVLDWQNLFYIINTFVNKFI